MTIQEAIQVVDNAVAMLQVNRQTHVQLQEAIATIKKNIQTGTEEIPKPK